jgi:phosphonate transport system ATP-binding protein
MHRGSANSLKHSCGLQMQMGAALLERPAFLRLEGVTVRLSGITILEKVSFTAGEGSIVAIVGPSGAGKTTLLRSVNGLTSVTSGSVNFIDRAKTARTGIKRARIATIFQEHALIGRLSAIENVLRGLVDRRAPLRFAFSWPYEIWCLAAQALAEVGLLDHAAMPVRLLSGGQRQRVGIARALIRDPELLLADEPFASSDPLLLQKLSSLVKTKVRAKGMTMLIVLHDLEIALAIADHVIGIRDGRIVFNGAASAFDSAAYEATYGAQPVRCPDFSTVARLTASDL